jgi:hypothetical protein
VVSNDASEAQVISSRAATEQSLAADGAIACFSSSFLLRGLNADRAPQLKAGVGCPRIAMNNEKQIANFLRANVEPWDEGFRGIYYRAAAYLRDQTYLPCVMFGNESNIIDLAIKRFRESANDEHNLRRIVGAFVASGSAVPIYSVSRVELSPFAWPLDLINQIHGETTMGWTSFTAKMNDGKLFAFGTTFNNEFFDLPAGYTYNDIVEIHSGMVMNGNGIEEPYSDDWSRQCYREKPFFYCYTDWLAC